MPLLSDFDQFQSMHWETGSLRNYYAYQGVTAPHTNQPYSEAMLLGISGGIVMGYFTFDYRGFDPMVQILTRNTFDPLETVYKRLDIQSNVLQTTNPERGINNLTDVLERGSPAIVFADMFSLPYNALPQNEGMWGIYPILVYGYEEDMDIVWIADRSRSPLTISTEELEIARGRTKKNQYRIQTHEPPNPDKLGSAVEAGIRDCIKLFTEPPPRGSKDNFGFLAFKKWENQLTKTAQRNSWAKVYSPGSRMYAALISTFTDITIFGKDGGAERQLYAQFMDEASSLLEISELSMIADKFRKSAEAWDDLSTALLPEEVPLFKETRELMLEKHHMFLEKGNSAFDEIHRIGDRLAEIKQQVSEDFPLNSSEASDLRASIADKITAVHNIEWDAVKDLKAIMGN